MNSDFTKYWKNLRIILVVCGILLGLYLLLAPVFPAAKFEIWEIGRDEISVSPYSDSETEIPGENTLVVPSINVDVLIVEGEDDSALDRGAWRRPGTSTPDAGGNTVITGHRFRYLPPNSTTFYNLDELETGDAIFVYWDGVEYEYEVTEVFVVEPDDTEIEADSVEPRLTLYTCTPLWTANKRLVVIADLVGQGNLGEM